MCWSRLSGVSLVKVGGVFMFLVSVLEASLMSVVGTPDSRLAKCVAMTVVARCCEYVMFPFSSVSCGSGFAHCPPLFLDGLCMNLLTLS